MIKDKNYPLVSIVTVSYKDDEYLPNLLSSIEQLEYPKDSLEIIVVSILASESVNDEIRENKTKKIPLTHIRISHRVGYSQAANLGISKALGEYIFLPNPDTYVQKTALSKLVSYIQDHADVGIVAPKVYLMDSPEKISFHDLPCRDFNRTLGKMYPTTEDEVALITQPKELYWLCGNGILVRKTLWEQVKKYDEQYFLYWEDADFSMKVREKGYKSILIPDATILHKGSASVGNGTDEQVYYGMRNGRYFIHKYSLFPGRFLLHISNIVLLISKSLQIVISPHKRHMSQVVIEGILDFYRRKRGCRVEK